MSLRNVVSKVCEKSAVGVKFRAWFRERSRALDTYFRRKRLQQYGPELLKKVDEIAEELGVPYFLDFGTLLGCVREKGFIKHDDDLDIGVLPGFHKKRELVKALLARGFVFRKGFECEGRLTEYAFYYKNVSIDFFFWDDFDEQRHSVEIYATGGVVPAGDDRIPVLSVTRAVRVKPSGLQRINFVGVHTMIPQNAEEILEGAYGPYWSHPVADWRPPADDPSRFKLETPAFVLGLNRVLDEGLK